MDTKSRPMRVPPQYMERKLQGPARLDLSLSAPDYKGMSSAEADMSSSSFSAEPGVNPVVHAFRSSYPPSSSHFLTVVAPRDALRTSPAERARLQRGALIPLYPTLRGQLLAISKEFSLPAVSGLMIYLVGDGNGGEGPKIGEAAWTALFGRHFQYEDDPSPQPKPGPFASTRRSSVQQSLNLSNESLLETPNQSQPLYAEASTSRTGITYLNHLASTRNESRTSESFPSQKAPASAFEIVGKVEWMVEEARAPWWSAWVASRSVSSEFRVPSGRKDILLAQHGHAQLRKPAEQPRETFNPHQPTRASTVLPAQSASSRHPSMQSTYSMKQSSADRNAHCSAPEMTTYSPKSQLSSAVHGKRHALATERQPLQMTATEGAVPSSMGTHREAQRGPDSNEPSHQTARNSATQTLELPTGQEAPLCSPQTVTGETHTGYSDLLNDEEEAAHHPLIEAYAVMSRGDATEATKLEDAPNTSNEDLWKDLSEPVVPFRNNMYVNKSQTGQPWTTAPSRALSRRATDGEPTVPMHSFSPPRSTTSRIQSWIGKTPIADAGAADHFDSMMSSEHEASESHKDPKTDVEAAEVVGLWPSNAQGELHDVPTIQAPPKEQKSRDTTQIGLGLPSSIDAGDMQKSLLSPIHLDLATFGGVQPNLNTANRSASPQLLSPHDFSNGASAMFQGRRHSLASQNLPGSRRGSLVQRDSGDLSETLSKMEKALELLSPSCSPNPAISPKIGSQNMSSRDSLAYARSISASVTPSPRWLERSKAASVKSGSHSSRPFVAGGSPFVREQVSPRPASLSAVSLPRSPNFVLTAPLSSTRLAELSRSDDPPERDRSDRSAAMLDDKPQETANVDQQDILAGFELVRGISLSSTSSQQVTATDEAPGSSKSLIEERTFIDTRILTSPGTESDYSSNSQAPFRTQPLSASILAKSVPRERWSQASHLTSDSTSVPFSRSLRSLTAELESILETSCSGSEAPIRAAIALQESTVVLPPTEDPADEPQVVPQLAESQADEADKAPQTPETQVEDAQTATQPEETLDEEVQGSAAMTASASEEPFPSMSSQSDYFESEPKQESEVETIPLASLSHTGRTMVSTPETAFNTATSPDNADCFSISDYPAHLDDYSLGEDEIRIMNEHTRAAVKGALTNASSHDPEPYSTPMSSKGSTSPTSSISNSSLFGACPVRRNASSGSLSSLTHDVASERSAKRKPGRLTIHDETSTQSLPNGSSRRRLASSSPKTRFQNLPASPSIHSNFKTLASSPLSTTFPTFSSPHPDDSPPAEDADESVFSLMSMTDALPA